MTDLLNHMTAESIESIESYRSVGHSLEDAMSETFAHSVAGVAVVRAVRAHYNFGTLYEFDTDVAVRPATEQEQTDSIVASMDEDGLGVIRVPGVGLCYVPPIEA